MNVSPVRRVTTPASWDELFERVIRPREPVVMAAPPSVRSAIDRWTFAYLAARAGDRPVEVECSPRGAQTRAELLSRTEIMPLRDLLVRLADADSAETYYYAERDFFGDLPELAADVDPLTIVPEELVTKRTGFVSNAQAHTAAHHHRTDEAAIVQIAGTKRMWLWDEQDLERLYPDGNWSAIPFRNRGPVDVRAYPKYGEVERVYEAALQPGDMLYIPTLSCHAAWAESPECISLTTFWQTHPTVWTSSDLHLEMLERAIRAATAEPNVTGS